MARNSHPGLPRTTLLVLGGAFLAVGGLSIFGTIRFATLAAWELPAYLLLGFSVLIAGLGIVLDIAGATARTRADATIRLRQALLFLFSLAVSIWLGNTVLGLLATDSTCDLKSQDPDYDPRPFHAAAPLCETGRPGTTPLEARYPPSLTLRHCNRDFDVTVRTTALGLRSIGRAPTEPRTLAIGDSFCFGWGVEDNESYAALLGWKNAGLWGRPPSTHVKALQWWASRLRPKRVVWEIYPPHLITELPSGWLSRYQYPNLHGPLTRAILDWYHDTGTGRFLHQRLGLAINRGNYFTKELMLYRKPTPQLATVYRSVRGHFDVARRLAEQFGLEIWFVLVPSKRMLEMQSTDPDVARLPMDLLKEQIIRAGFAPEQVIDLLPAFAESRNAGLFFLHDAHWTPAGHRFVADRLRRSIPSRPAGR